MIGEGDSLRDCKWKKYHRSISLTDQAFDDTGGFSYTLTLYPTDAMFEMYSTKNPSVAAFGVACVIVFTSLMFALYDCLMSKSIRKKGSLLAAKREFVRYVSHEVRTPLNTVCLGLNLLQDDLQQAFGKKKKHHKKDLPALLGDEEEEKSSSPAVEGQQSAQASALQLAEEILTSAHSAVSVLNDFLNYDKIENKSLTLDLSVLNVWHGLEQTLTTFKVPAEAKTVDLRLDFDTLGETDEVERPLPVCGSAKDLPLSTLQKRMIADPARIAQVFRNLLSNAIKFTGNGGKVTVNAKWIPPASTPKPKKGGQHDLVTLSNGTEIIASSVGFIQVTIQDNGAGMTKKQLDQVFAAGVQFNRNMLQSGEGSGLGMYIAKEIVAQHGGLLTARSDGIGMGSTFVVLLPLYYIPDDCLPDGLHRKLQLQLSAESFAGPGESASREDHQMAITSNKVFEPLHILVVDDAVSNRKLLQRMLERMGHICDEAKDGAEAIQKVLGDGQVEGRPYFDTILLDSEMPVLSGPDAVKKLRDEGVDSFVVGITGNVLPEDISYFKRCGANEVLHKPVDFDALGALWMEFGIGGGNADLGQVVESMPPVLLRD